MVNEDILTGLKNAVEHGESLESAIQVMVDSGYNLKEVQEASQFISGGVTSRLQAKPDEHLVMPDEKGFFSKLRAQKTPSEATPIQSSIKQDAQKIKQEISQTSPATAYNPPVSSKVDYNTPIIVSDYDPTPLEPQLNKIRPKKSGYLKEIILLIILLFLVGLLVLTIVFRNQILSLFSGL